MRQKRVRRKDKAQKSNSKREYGGCEDSRRECYSSEKSGTTTILNPANHILGTEFSPSILSCRRSSFKSPDGSLDAARDKRHDISRPLNGRCSQVYELGADFQHA